MPVGAAAAAALGIGYRDARDDDLPFLAQVYASTRTEEIAATGWPDAAKAAFLEQQFQAQHSHYRGQYTDTEWLVIEREGTAIGRLYLARWKDETRIVDISLLPEWRGAGIGAAILTDLAAEATASGKPLTIHVERYNPARRLYLRLGFAPQAGEGVYEMMTLAPGALQDPRAGAASN